MASDREVQQGHHAGAAHHPCSAPARAASRRLIDGLGETRCTCDIVERGGRNRDVSIIEAPASSTNFFFVGESAFLISKCAS